MALRGEAVVGWRASGSSNLSKMTDDLALVLTMGFVSWHSMEESAVL